jgi:hypothetical protein
MTTIEQEFGLLALVTIKKGQEGCNNDQKKLKELYNQATELPLLFHTQGLRIAFVKIFAKNSTFKELFLRDNLGLSNTLNEYDLQRKLASFSLEENHLYLPVVHLGNNGF